MNPEIKQKWVKALRSGEYKQSIERLHDNTGFCCLGVLCDIVKDDVGAEWLEQTFDDGTTRYILDNGDYAATATLPPTS